MAYSLYTASYGIQNANAKVMILEASTGKPATILASATGGVITDQGLTKLDSSGNLSVYIDTAKTWQFYINDLQPAQSAPVTGRVDPETQTTSLLVGNYPVAAASLTTEQVTALQGMVSGDGFSDHVDPSAGQPLASDRGAAITYRSNGASVVASGGFLTSGAGTGTRAWYAEKYSPNGCTRLGAEFKFTAGSTGRNGCIALILWTASVTESTDIPATPAHLTITRWGWTLGTSPETNGVITNYASGRFNSALSAGVVYSAELCVDGGKAYLRLPDGTTATATDAALSSMVVTHPGWEFFQFDGAADDRVQIGRVWMDGADQSAQGGGAQLAALLDIPRRPTAKKLTSISSSSIPTSDTIIDAAAVCPVYSGPTGSADVLCSFTVWATLAAGRQMIFCPKFVDIDGAVITQPFDFAFKAPSGGWDSYITYETVYTLASDKPFNCEFRAFSTGAGDSYAVDANKPLTMSFTPLG